MREISLYNQEVISAYSREDAIQDGLLIDVTDAAKKAGIKYPVAATRNLWERYINHEDKDARLWDLLWLFKLKAMHESSDELSFNVTFTNDNPKELVRLWAVCGPGDLLEPVITIMLPEDY